ncbi:ADP-ribosylglycohydrolase family protein [Zobellia roscoffensis]|uniref:ADP-ribosylglycohydrolase family protein n=1 Tax=Zobellia roscoffensis TaxID=2779508 RepID=UPI00188C71EE|nr:ADP-ribosylglycohydrolase family protein [Zobellia roscoffensis]
MKRLLACLMIFAAMACKESTTSIDIPAPTKTAYTLDTLQLSEEEYYDKVLGALVGSAIGDAMGASTEMWHRKDIQLKYGYITTLTPAVRQQSPEGTWGHNLIAGATTDDTRWKYAMVKYLSQNKGDLNASNFANFITDYYASLTKSINDNGTIPETDFLDTQIEKIDWIKEWARVSMAYEKDTDSYLKAMNRFYGGEMSCAGQLYTPMFGLISNSPENAYTLAYNHTLFDIGYAKDISALVSAMTHMALRTKNIDSIINTATFVDPLRYQDSRLVGRIAYDMTDASVKKVLALKQLILVDTLTPKDSITFKIPEGFQGSHKDWTRQEMAYQFLEKNEKAIAFHSGEIWQILVTALQYGEGDFEKTLQFIVNYGRDNDTVAAVAGMILGAKDGYSNLPVTLRTQALKVNKENMGIDLEALAREMVAKKHMEF